MSDSVSAPHSDSENTNARTRERSWFSTPFFAIVLPVAVAALLYPLEPVLLPVQLGRSRWRFHNDTNKGLLKVTNEKKVELLVDEFEGIKFKLIDGVDVANDGTIYFTDASHKYPAKDAVLDILEGKPNGRFLSYNPTTKKTTLLAQDLYFANGVAVSADQQFVVFCESVLMRCNKFYVQGPKKGTIEKFCGLPGMPDNIHYDGHGHYLIAMFTGLTPELDLAFRYPFIRKVVAIVTKYVWPLSLSKNGGVLVVDLEGKPIAHYYDPKLVLTSAIKIGNHIYADSVFYPFVTRFDIGKYPALPTV